MGSDLYMNPPREQFDQYTCADEEEAMSYVVGAMAIGKKVIVNEASSNGQILVQVSTGEWW